MKNATNVADLLALHGQTITPPRRRWTVRLFRAFMAAIGRPRPTFNDEERTESERIAFDAISAELAAHDEMVAEMLASIEAKPAEEVT